MSRARQGQVKCLALEAKLLEGFGDAALQDARPLGADCERESDRLWRGELGKQRREKRVVEIDRGKAAPGRHAPQGESLLAGDRSQVVQLLEMLGADGGHDGRRGAREVQVPVHGADLVDPDLDDGSLVLGAQAQKRHGDPDVAVSAALGFVDAPAPRQRRGEQVLGGRLADASRDGGDGDIEGPAPGRREGLVGPERIGHGEDPHGGIRNRDGPRREDAAGAPGDRPGDEVVAVVALAADRHEERAAGDRARVGRNSGEGGIGARRDGQAERLRDKARRELRQRALPARPGASLRGGAASGPRPCRGSCAAGR